VELREKGARSKLRDMHDIIALPLAIALQPHPVDKMSVITELHRRATEDYNTAFKAWEEEQDCTVTWCFARSPCRHSLLRNYIHVYSPLAWMAQPHHTREVAG